jgi:hypothetical protein
MTVYVPPAREAIYAALFAKFQQTSMTWTNSPYTPTGPKAFVTTGRALRSQEQINAIEKPAMFMLQADEDWKQNNSGLPYVSEALVEVYIFVAQPDDLIAPVPQINNLIDATLATIAPNFPGQKQTLGGLVDNVVLRGKAEYRLGLQGVINAFAVFPVTIIMPNIQQGLG